MNKIVAILSLIFIHHFLNGQIVFTGNVYPGVRVIKTTQFGGSGGRGYWNYKYLDKKGRVILEEKYKKKNLLAVYSHRFDEHDNKVSSTTMYDINYPDGQSEYRVSKYSYRYDTSGTVIEQETTIGKSNCITRISQQIGSNKFDIIEICRSDYSEIPKIDTILTTIELNDKGQIIKNIENQIRDTGTVTTEYIYFDNGKLKRRIIYRNPMPKMETVYTGSAQ